MKKIENNNPEIKFLNSYTQNILRDSRTQIVFENLPRETSRETSRETLQNKRVKNIIVYDLTHRTMFQGSRILKINLCEKIENTNSEIKFLYYYT